MGVYINMEMPPVGRILIVFPSGRVLEVSADETQNIFRGAQAVPVPAHGKLGDLDALMSRIEYDATLSSTFEKVVRWYIENAPTIIPAEEGET